MLKCYPLEWSSVKKKLKIDNTFFDNWEKELKIDGSRELWVKDKLMSARGIEHNDRYRHVVNALKIGLKGLDYVLDGEIALGESSNVLALNKKDNWSKAMFYVFDIMEYQGKSVRDLRLEDRKKMLEILIKQINNPYVKMIKSFDKIEEAWKYVITNDLEGLVVKRKGSKYLSADILKPLRTNDWYKIKNWKETKEKVVDFIKGSEKGAFILENGSKVSTLENGVGELFLTYKKANKKVYAEIFFMMKTSGNRLFQPKLKRLVDDKNNVLWESGG